MVDFVADTPPLDTPESDAAKIYAATPPTWGEAIGAAAGDNPMAAIMRASERGEQPGSSFFDQAATAYALAGAGQIYQPPQDTSDDLSPEEVKKQYGFDTQKPMSEGLARIVGQQKQDETDRQATWSRFANAHSWPTNFAAGTVAFMMDPLNVASLFVPGLGEESIAGRLGGGVAARFVGRAGEQATAAALGQAPLVGLRAGLGAEQDSDYGLRDAFRDVGFAAVLGAAGGVASGLLHETGMLPPDDLMRADTVHHALKASVAQIIDEAPVNVSPIFDVAAADRASGELQSWLAQRQVIDAETNDAIMSSDVTGQAAQDNLARMGAVDRQLTGLRDQHASFLDEIEQARARLPDLTYQGTADRIAAVDQDLAQPALSAERRSALEQERRMLTEGAPSDNAALEVARTQAQIRGLQAGARRLERQIAGREQRLAAARAGAELAQRTGDRMLAIRSAAIESRERVVQALASRTIRRYAGRIGTPLEDGEADQLAQRVLAGDSSVESTVAGLRDRATGNPYFPLETSASPEDIVAQTSADLRSRAQSPAQLAEQLTAQRRAGYAAGVPQPEFDATKESLYGPEAQEKAPPEPTPEDQNAQMAALEAQVTAHPDFSENDRAILDAADQEIADAANAAEGYAQAGECLTGAGV